MAWITLAVEGIVDQAVATRVAAAHGHIVAAAHVTGGKSRLDRNLRGYNNAARFSPWLVLRDLNHDAPCPSALLSEICPVPASQMILRIAVREMESWVLADRNGMARVLGVPLADIPHDPDALLDPKRTVVDLARRSRHRRIRRDMVPPPGLSASIGPGYNRHLIAFVTERWDPDRAEAVSGSLARCRQALSRVL